MKITILLVVLVFLILFSLFYRLYKRKYESFQATTKVNICRANELQMKYQVDTNIQRVNDVFMIPFEKGMSITNNLSLDAIKYPINSVDERRKFYEKILLDFKNYLVNLNEKVFSNLIITRIRNKTSKNNEDNNDESIVETYMIKSPNFEYDDTGETIDIDLNDKFYDFYKFKKFNHYFLYVKIGFNFDQYNQFKEIAVNSKDYPRIKSYFSMIDEVTTLRFPIDGDIRINMYKLLFISQVMQLDETVEQFQSSTTQITTSSSPTVLGIEYDENRHNFNSFIYKLNDELTIHNLNLKLLIEIYFSFQKIENEFDGLMLDQSFLIPIEKQINSICNDENFEKIVKLKPYLDYFYKIYKIQAYLVDNDRIKTEEYTEHLNFHNFYKNKLQDIILDSIQNNNQEIGMDNQAQLNQLNSKIDNIKDNITNVKKVRNKYKDNYLGIKNLNLQNIVSGSFLNFAEIFNRRQSLNKYILFANEGVLSMIRNKLKITYDYEYNLRESFLHWELTVINNKEEYKNYMRNDTNSTDVPYMDDLNELPFVLISPSSNKKKVLSMIGDKLFIKYVSGDKTERFRFTDLKQKKSCN